MGKTTGFLEYARIDPKKRPPEERIKDWAEIRLPQDPEIVRTQGARCMNCGVPFCQGGVLLEGVTSGCPLHNLIPEWNGLVYEGQWEDAYKRLTRTNPFPEFTARVCPAPCEGSCTEGHIMEPVIMEPVTINSLEYEIIERAFAEGWVATKKAQATGKRIAVVGSGPAGLSAAYYLNLVGHDITVFERDDRAGGLMMYGIPNMKLEKRYVERRLELMKASGIQFVLNTEVGKDISSQELVDGFDAVLLCAGATKGRRLDIEGQELQGVHLAVDFLKAITQSLLDSSLADGCYPSAQGKHVIVIGGGDTGTDCVATSIRLGCASVCQFEILPEPPEKRIEASNPWPEWPNKRKVDYGQEEALSVYGQDPRHYLLSAQIIVGNDQGEVEAVKTVAIRWEKDAAGRLVPHDVPGSEKLWKADLVLLALGFLGPEDSIPDELMLVRDTKTNVKADYEVFKTNVDKVFVAGDMRRGQSLIVWAIQEGKLAAREIDKCLMGKSLIK